VVLEFAKDQILGVDTMRQYLPPCVRYGTAICMLSVVCRARLSGDDIILCDLSFIILYELLEPHNARGDVCVGNLSTVCGDRLFGKP
jgi:hypothetical protein